MNSNPKEKSLRKVNKIVRVICLHMLSRNIKILLFDVVLKVVGNLMMTTVEKIL
jgi:hypothetical protein